MCDSFMAMIVGPKYFHPQLEAISIRALRGIEAYQLLVADELTDEPTVNTDVVFAVICIIPTAKKKWTVDVARNTVEYWRHGLVAGAARGVILIDDCSPPAVSTSTTDRGGVCFTSADGYPVGFNESSLLLRSRLEPTRHLDNTLSNSLRSVIVFVSVKRSTCIFTFVHASTVRRSAEEIRRRVLSTFATTTDSDSMVRLYS